MDPPKKAEFDLEIFTDPACAKDMIKGVLHTIFFHRIFPAARPTSRDVLDTTLPAVDDVDLETLIDQRASVLIRQIDNNPQQSSMNPPSRNGSSGRGELAVQFFEKKRRKSYFFGKGDEEVCWEQWTVHVALARPKTESDAEKVRSAMEKSLQKAAMKIVTIAGEERDHIPPITTNDTNPFPYTILVNPREQTWNKGMGIF